MGWSTIYQADTPHDGGGTTKSDAEIAKWRMKDSESKTGADGMATFLKRTGLTAEEGQRWEFLTDKGKDYAGWTMRARPQLVSP